MSPTRNDASKHQKQTLLCPELKKLHALGAGGKSPRDVCVCKMCVYMCSYVCCCCCCRMAVAYVFPMFMIPVSLVRGCICFKRGSIADKQVRTCCLIRQAGPFTVCHAVVVRQWHQAAAEGGGCLTPGRRQGPPTPLSAPLSAPVCVCVCCTHTSASAPCPCTSPFRPCCKAYLSICPLQKFNAWIDKCVAASPQPGICLFPEGEQEALWAQQGEGCVEGGGQGGPTHLLECRHPQRTHTYTHRHNTQLL